jgi:glycosyltransferase involved in cell wall biosynthesis
MVFNGSMTVEFILPVFNEEEILRKNAEILLEHLRRAPYPYIWGITIAVNGSNDRSEAIARELAAEYPGHVQVRILEEGGKGNALRHAALESTADFLVFMDVDLAVSLEHIPDILSPIVKDEADLVIASRLLPGSRTERSVLRSFSSRAYNLLSRIILGHRLSDLQCGFKAGKRDMFHSILPAVRNEGWFFDTELVTLALRAGARVREVPISWMENRYAERKSKINFIGDSARFFINLLRLRARFLKEKYDGFFRRHAWALVLAIAVGALYAAPHVYFAQTPGYQGVYLSESSDEAFYLTTINKSFDRSTPVGNPYLFEYQEDRNPFQYYFVEFLLGKVGRMLNLSTDALAIGMKFFFPALVMLVVYALGLAISRSRLAAICTAAAVLLGNELARPSMADALHTLTLQSPFTEFLLYSRPVNPQVSSLFFFGALIAFYFLIQNPRSRWSPAAAGIFTGALAYIYFFFWAYLLALGGVLFLYALIARKWELAKGAAFATGTGALLSLPFLAAIASTLFAGTVSTLAHAVPSREIIIEKMLVLPLGMYALFCFFSPYFRRKYLFVLLLLVAGLLASNQQVVTGKLLQQHHFHFFVNIPLFVLASSLLITEGFRLLSQSWRLAAASIMLAILFWHAVGVQTASYRAHAPEYARYQSLGPIISWLRNHPGAVVLGGDIIANRLTMYTQNFLYSSSYDSNYQVPPERLRHDYFVTLALRGVSAADIREYVYEKKNREEVGVLLFGGQYYRDLCGSYGCFEDSILEGLISEYKIFSSLPLVDQLHTYKLDFLLVDRVGDWSTAGLRLGAPVASSGDFTLYDVRRD